MLRKSAIACLIALLAGVTATAETETSVYVYSLYDFAADCQPDYHPKNPDCFKAAALVVDARKQIEKSEEVTLADSEDAAALVVSLHPTFKDTGKYVVRDNSRTVGDTTVLDVDVKQLKVKSIGTTVYVAGEIADTFHAKNVKDVLKKLREYR
jgi:hypothetical protein